MPAVTNEASKAELIASKGQRRKVGLFNPLERSDVSRPFCNVYFNTGFFNKTIDSHTY